jgi:hypothetical protein
MLAPRFDPAEIEYWAKRYDYPLEETVEDGVGPRALERGYLTRDDFLILCRWKTPRALKHCRSNTAPFVEEATYTALSADHERMRLGVLTLLSGVQTPTASSILHFCHPDPYPILDVRALGSLGFEQRHAYYTFDVWRNYVVVCRALADEHGVSMRILDRALWQYSKERQG